MRPATLALALGLAATSLVLLASCRSASTPAERQANRRANETSGHPAANESTATAGASRPAPQTRAAMTTPSSPVREGHIGRDRFATTHGSDNPGVALWKLPVSAGQGPERFVPLPDLIGGPRAVALSAAGDRVAAAAAEGGAIRLIDVAATAGGGGGAGHITELVGPGARVAALAFSPDGAWLGAAGQNPAEPPDSADVDSPKAVAYISGGLVLLWRSSDVAARPVTLAGPSAAAVAVAFSPDSKRVTALYKDGTCVSWELGTFAEAARASLAGRGHALAYGPSGTLAITRTDPAGSGIFVELVDGATLEPRKTLSAGSSWPEHVAWSPDGARLVVSARDAVFVFDVSTGKQIARLDYGSRAHGPDPRAAGFVAGGLLVLGGERQAWVLWDVATGAARASSGS